MEYVFSFDNTHEAIYSENLLLKGGIKVKVMSLPSQIKAGCGSCLRINPDEFCKSKEILDSKKITYSGVFSFEKINGESVFTKQ